MRKYGFFFFLTEVKQETCLLVCLQFKGPQLQVYISQQNIHDGLVSTGVFSACSDAFSQTTESLSIRVSASWLDLVGVWLLNPPTWFGPQPHGCHFTFLSNSGCHTVMFLAAIVHHFKK